jgi:hypothetical protein
VAEQLFYGGPLLRVSSQACRKPIAGILHGEVADSRPIHTTPEQEVLVLYKALKYGFKLILSASGYPNHVLILIHQYTDNKWLIDG